MFIRRERSVIVIHVLTIVCPPHSICFTSVLLQAVDSRAAAADGRLRSLAELRQACDEQRDQLRELERLAETARENLSEPEAQNVTSQVSSRTCRTSPVR